ncbi:MAG: nucleotidyltransferase family protein [Gemmatimonadaceae bacterium]
MNAETELALTLSRTPLGERAKSRIEALLSGRLDWDTVFALAAQWEVEPVVFSNLRPFLEGKVEPSIIERAALRGRESRGYALARTLVLVHLEKKFRAAGIDVLVLKGPSVGVIAYDDPSMRSFADVDFLVRRRDLEKSRDLLLEMGFERDYDPGSEWNLLNGDHALEFSGTRAKVELHFALLERHLRFGMKLDDVWADSTMIECVGSDLRAMSRPHLMLFLCAHAAKHEWARLRWICDVAQLSSRMSDGEVKATVALARTLGARRLLALGLRLAHDILSEEVTRFSVGELASERETSRAMQSVEEALGLRPGQAGLRRGRLDGLGPGMRPLLFWLGVRERLADRIVSLAWVAFVPTDTDKRRGFAGWLSRPVRLASRIVRKNVTAS